MLEVRSLEIDLYHGNNKDKSLITIAELQYDIRRFARFHTKPIVETMLLLAGKDFVGFNPDDIRECIANVVQGYEEDVKKLQGRLELVKFDSGRMAWEGNVEGKNLVADMRIVFTKVMD